LNIKVSAHHVPRDENYQFQTFQTMNSVRSNNISLKYQRFTTLDSKDILMIKSEFVAKTRFLCGKDSIHLRNFSLLLFQNVQ